MVNKKKYSVIRLSEETREKLKEFGKKGNSYEDIIKKLMEEVEKCRKST
jgi:predicted DNA-binding protein